MWSYSERKVFDSHHMLVYEQACKLVDAITPGLAEFRAPGQDIELRCHELARAVSLALAAHHTLIVIDGKLGPIEHTWLWIATERPMILDVYTPGRMPQVQLIDVLVSLSGTGYVRGRQRRDIDHPRVDALVEFFRSLFPELVPATVRRSR
ncbi:MAG TPA: hypothetical protein VLT45_04510 [Kofleriaceae bacterium]|nr:hypothetical protein [Kofleriaceae bacterium]